MSGSDLEPDRQPGSRRTWSAVPTKKTPKGSSRAWLALIGACVASVIGLPPGLLNASYETDSQAGQGRGATLSSAVWLLPDTSDRIIPFADQLQPDYSDRLVEFIAKHFAGTQKMRRADNARFRQWNPRWVLLHYRLAVSSGPVEYIHDNRWSSDWNEVNAHEDWFLHNELGKRHHDAVSNWDVHDPQNAAFRDYWASSVISDMRATGSQGVFADSFEAGVSGYGITPPDPRFAGTAPADPKAWKDGQSWAVLKTEFADDMMRRFAATPEKFMYVANLGDLTTSWWWPHYPHLDGAMLEGFADTNSFEDWFLAMNRALELTRPGKFVIIQAYPNNVQDRLFLVASYLLIKGQHTFVNAARAGVSYFPEYDLPFGPANDPLPTDISAYSWNGIFKREFRDAVVLVNPRPEPATVILPQTFALVTPVGGGVTGDAQLDPKLRYIGGSLTYQEVTRMTLPGRTGALLKRKGPSD